MPTTVFTLRIDDKLKQQLESLAAATQRTKSFLAAEALRVYLANEEWLLTEIREGQRQARAGMTVSGQEMDELLASLEVERKGSLPRPSGRQRQRDEPADAANMDAAGKATSPRNQGRNSERQ